MREAYSKEERKAVWVDTEGKKEQQGMNRTGRKGQATRPLAGHGEENSVYPECNGKTLKTYKKPL